jgi:hypothetical protein
MVPEAMLPDENRNRIALTAVTAVYRPRSCGLAGQVGVRREILDEVVMLQKMDRFESEVVTRKVEIAVDVSGVLPIIRKPGNGQIDRRFFVPHLARRPELHVVRVFAGHFERPISESDFNDMDADIRSCNFGWRKTDTLILVTVSPLLLNLAAGMLRMLSRHRRVAQDVILRDRTHGSSRSRCFRSSLGIGTRSRPY